MTDYLMGARFPLPDDWQPEGTMCVKVVIPNDQQYFGILIGLIDLLRQSKSFARDETKTGAATVSRTWERALNSQPIEIEDCMGCCPDEITVPAPFPSADDGNLDAAANVIKNIHQPLAALAQANCSVSREQYVTEATAHMRQFDPNWSGMSVLSAIYDKMCELTEPEQDEYQEDLSYCTQFCELKECSSITGAWDLLDCLNEKLTEWLDSTNDDLMDWLNKAAALMTGNGWQNAAGYGGAGGSAGFSGDCCGFTHTDDMQSGMHGWDFVALPAGDTYDPSGVLGVWESGDGARTQPSATQPAGGYRLYMGQVLTPATVLNTVRVISGFATGTNTTEVFRVLAGVRTQINGSVQRDPMDAVDCGLYGTGADVTFDCGGLLFDELEIYISSASNESWICQVIITGEGSDPFGA